MLHKSYCLPLILVVAFLGTLSFMSCQTSNENTKYLDEEELDLEQVIVDSLRLDKRLKVLLSSNQSQEVSNSSEELKLMFLDIPEELGYLTGTKDSFFFELLDKEIEQVHRREIKRIEDVLKCFNARLRTQPCHHISWRIALVHKVGFIRARRCGSFPTPLEYPRFSRVKYFENEGGNVGFFVVKQSTIAVYSRFFRL